MRELGLAISLSFCLAALCSSGRAGAQAPGAYHHQGGRGARESEPVDSAEPRLTLRPAHGLEELAAKTARVLALRGHIRVDLGSEPPPGLLEAVPAGHVALARASGGAVLLVMGAARGASYDTHVALSRHTRAGDSEADVRALALALEALHDRALQGALTAQLAEQAAAASAAPVEVVAPELVVELEPASPEPELAPVAEAVEPAETAAPLPLVAAAVAVPPLVLPELTAADRGAPKYRDEGSAHGNPEHNDRALRVAPLLYFSLYGGASTQSSAPRTGLGMGGGLCVKGQCVLLAIEYPLPFGLEGGGKDVRYRYPTFSCSFHSRPFHVGRFTPGVSVGFLSRVGYFERDMGLPDSRSGLDTDLALRGTLEGAYAVVDAVDLVAEGGVDYALDRWTMGHGGSFAYRGPRASPWLQASIRIRPYY